MIASFHVRMAMRDGVSLSADLYCPDGHGRHPTVLIRTCYTKALGSHRERAAFWTSHGYAYLIQDVRGRGDSDGRFEPFRHEIEDGSDTIDWIARQAWSDGRVVMTGSSYLGMAQLYAACSGNSHLEALVPMTTPPDPDRCFPMSYGMILPAAACWAAMVDGRVNQDVSVTDLDHAFAQRPIIDFDRAIGRRLGWWRDWVNHISSAAFWEERAYQARLLSCTQSMLHISGWYDDCLMGVLENFAALTARASIGGAPAQRLLIGPWLHGTIGQRRSGDIDYGDAAEVDLNQLQLQWFESCLREAPLPSAPVQLFVMGRNAWLHEQEWPIRRTQYLSLYLHSAGNANTRLGDGTLSTTPAGEEPPDRFEHDPDQPVPYSPKLQWTQIGGPDDYSEIELRQDVLVYTSAPLEEPLLVCGRLRVRLFAASSACDTDWAAKVLDVWPDGRAIRLNDGAVRARFRKGHTREELLVAGEIVEYEIDCWATCIELQPGHCLRLEIASSALGKYDVNLNGGGRIGYERAAIVASQSVYHDAAHASQLLLPVLPSS